MQLAVGDDVLRVMARALSAHVREGDVLARYGGEECILYLPITEVCALAIANQMRAEVEAAAIPASTPPSAAASPSPPPKAPLKQLIKAADNALYAAKAAGKNACRVRRGM